MLKHLNFLRRLKKSFAFTDAALLVTKINMEAEEIKLPGLKRTLFFRKKTKDVETFKEIFESGIYNLKLPIEPKFIVDAGSNTGFASLFFKMKYPQARIVCLEIEGENVKMIRKNLEGLNDIEVIQKGLFNRKSFFNIEDPFNATNSFVLKEVGAGEKYEIESITIDEILENSGIQNIDILKIDIEGAEKDLFEKNYQNWLPRVKVIMVETHDRMIPGCSYSVMKAMHENNFILFTTTEGTLIYYNMSLIQLN